MDTTKQERLRKAFDYLVFRGYFSTQGDFANVIGANKTNLSSAMNGNEKYLSDSLFAKISAAYPEINLEWLRTGNGEMLKVRPAVMSPYDDTAAVASQQQVFAQAMRSGHNVVGDAGNINMSFIPTEIVEEIRNEAKAELAQGVAPETVMAEVSPTGEVSIISQPPVVPDSVARRPNYDLMTWLESGEDHAQHVFNITEILRKTKFIVKTTNNAMAPTLFQNEFVFMKPMPEGMLITDGDIYGIDTKHRGILIRHLYDNGDTFLARPKNQQEYGDLEIPKKEVIRSYIILFHGSTQMSSMPSNEAERDKQISQQGEQINALIGQLGDSMKEISRAGERQDKLIEMIEKKL